MTDFHNPYHFIPSKKGSRLHDVKRSDFDKRSDCARLFHDRYVDNTHSGRLICRLTAETPLFVGATRPEEGTKDHPSIVQPFELEKKPAIPASSLRGMISSLAEAASNSALRVLEDRAYSYRKPMRGGALSAIGMIVKDEKKAYRLRAITLPMGVKDHNSHNFIYPKIWKNLCPVPNFPVYIGSVNTIKDSSFNYRTYRKDNPQYFGLRLNTLLWEDQEEDFKVAGPYSSFHIKDEACLISQHAFTPEGEIDTDPSPIKWEEINESDKANQSKQHCFKKGILRVLGVWGRQIPLFKPATQNQKEKRGKKHELFLPIPENWESWPEIEIPDPVVDLFHEICDDRTETVKKEDAPLVPYEPRDTDRNTNCEKYGKNFRLKVGDLVYFDIAQESENDQPFVAEISMSAIWRGAVPDENGGRASAHTFFRSIDPDLVPMHSGRENITLAEQMFGFVETIQEKDKESYRQRARSALALKSRIRFSDARLDPKWSGRNPSPYLEAVTLKILGAPKPPCPSMYFKGKGSDQNPIGVGMYIPKADTPQGLVGLNLKDHWPNGRKVYLHHPLKNDYHTNPPWKTTHETENLKQKVRITPVTSSAVFYFHIDFDNLSDEELWLLCYALCPAPAFRHKIGMGKPLGLGSVFLETVGYFRVNRTDRYSLEGFFKPRYSQVWTKEHEDLEKWPKFYKREKETNQEGSFNLLELLQNCELSLDPDIKQAIEWLGDPSKVTASVHTPQVEEENDLEVETFGWFVKNDDKSNEEDRQFLKPIRENEPQLKRLPRLVRGRAPGGRPPYNQSRNHRR